MTDTFTIAFLGLGLFICYLFMWSFVLSRPNINKIHLGLRIQGNAARWVGVGLILWAVIRLILGL
jgi:hypothetical protein